MSRKKGYPFHLHPKIIALIVIGLVLLAAIAVFAKNNGEGGFDEFGYNKTARIFEGKADGADRNLDGTLWGDPTYGNDHLKMNWNAEWDRGNREGWAKPPYRAWLDNNWNGKVQGGSGEVWQYKIVWNGPCGANGASLDSGGYCIWGQFAVILSQGTVDNQHFWDAHAHPAGFGAY